MINPVDGITQIAVQMCSSSTELVNAVGGGDFGTQLDFGQVQRILEGYDYVYDPEYHPAIKIKFNPEGATVLLFQTGKYNIAGADSIKSLRETSNRILSVLNPILQIQEEDRTPEFEVRNLVLLHNTSYEFDLENLLELLGENASYDPEKYSYLMYKPDYAEGVFMLFRTGKIILTGEADLNMAHDSIEKILTELPY